MGAQVFPYLPPHLLISPAAHERVSCFLTQLDPWLIKRVDVVELPGNSGRHFKYIYELTHMVGVHFGQSECHRGTTRRARAQAVPISSASISSDSLRPRKYETDSYSAWIFGRVTSLSKCSTRKNVTTLSSGPSE